MDSNESIATTKLYTALFMAAALVMTTATPVFAQDFICSTIIYIFRTYIYFGLATLAVIIVGISALMGKVSWGMAVGVAVGIAVVSGSVSILGALVAGSGATLVASC